MAKQPKISDKETWNIWATSMLREREKLISKGSWMLNQDGVGQNKATEKWMADSETILSKEFTERKKIGNDKIETADFIGYIFPGNFDCVCSELNNADFSNSVFYGNANFSGSVFKGRTWFKCVKFKGQAWFGNTIFGTKSDSADEVSFRDSVFDYDARFEEAVFYGKALFGEVQFNGTARFHHAEFHGYTHFTQSYFAALTLFYKAKFFDEADFSAIVSKRVFRLSSTYFNKLPDFRQSTFATAPVISANNFGTVQVQPSTYPAYPNKKLPSGHFKYPNDHPINDFDPQGRNRALQDIATQSGDDLTAHEFFVRQFGGGTAKELTLPKIFNQMGTWFLLSLYFLYGILSDYGRSVFRPVFCWFLLAVVSFCSYSAQHVYIMPISRHIIDGNTLVQNISSEAGSGCYLGATGKRGSLPLEIASTTRAVNELVRLTFTNGTILSDLGSENQRRMLGCLYGFELQNNASIGAPILPPFVATVAALQKLLSVVFIFLFGLGLRFHLKFKG